MEFPALNRKLLFVQSQYSRKFSRRAAGFIDFPEKMGIINYRERWSEWLGGPASQGQDPWDCRYSLKGLLF